MSIHRTNAGTYRVRWRQQDRLRSKSFKRKHEAEKFQVKLNSDNQDNKQYPIAESPVRSFEDLAEYWLENYAEIRKAPSSVILDKQLLRDHILPSIGPMKLQRIKTTDVAGIQSGLVREGSLSTKTINLVLSLVHKIFDDALLWEFTPINPCKGIRPIKGPAQDFALWTFEDRDSFLAYAERQNHCVYEIIATAVHTGMRKGELQGLLRDCVDFKRREILVKRSYCQKTKRLNEYTKGKNIRRIPMNPLVCDILRTRTDLFEHQRIFEYDFAHLAWRHFKPMQQALGIKVIRFHDLRHTFASHLAMSGVSMFDIQQLMGHQSVHTTQRYMHLTPNHMRGRTDVLLKR